MVNRDTIIKISLRYKTHPLRCVIDTKTTNRHYGDTKWQ